MKSATNTTYTVTALEDKEVTLKPVVTAKEGTELAFSWTVGSNEVSTDAAYTFKYNGTDGYQVVCKVYDKNAKTNSVTLTYTVNKVDTTNPANKPSVDKIDAQVYTGNAIEPAVNVKLGASFVGELVVGKDYTVKYENNINVGTARVAVTMSKELGGAVVETTFPIDRAVNEVEIANVEAKVGGDITPVVTKNLGKGNVTFTYYKDSACTDEVAAEVVKKTAGNYYVVATAIATANYNEAKSAAATVKVTGSDEVELGKTSKISAATTKSTSIKLSWKAVEGADSYRVYVAKDGAWKVLKSGVTGTTFTVKDLTAGKSYKFAVKAFNGKVAAKTFTTATLKTAPGVTKSIKASRGYTSVKLTWNKVTGADGYRVYIAQNGKWVQVRKSGASNTFTKTGLKSGKSYKFAVKAYTKDGDKVLWADTYKSVTAKTVKK